MRNISSLVLITWNVVESPELVIDFLLLWQDLMASHKCFVERNPHICKTTV